MIKISEAKKTAILDSIRSHPHLAPLLTDSLLSVIYIPITGRSGPKPAQTRHEPQVERDAFIVAARRSVPPISLHDLGALFSMTRERVRQIAKRDGAHTPHFGTSSHRHERVQLLADNQDVIMMRYMSGETAATIARELSLPRNAVEAMVARSTTDRIAAFRAQTIAAKHGVSRNHRIYHTAVRSDRKWTERLVLASLVQFVVDHDLDRLPSIADYSRFLEGDDNLTASLPRPSTVRLRLGPWRNVRVMVDDEINRIANASS